jgi:hypothetical protein
VTQQLAGAQDLGAATSQAYGTTTTTAAMTLSGPYTLGVQEALHGTSQRVAPAALVTGGCLPRATCCVMSWLAA